MEENKNIEVMLYGDESGQLHSNSKSEYFCIGGYYCNKDDSNSIKRSFSRKLIKIKKKRGMLKSDELKSREMTNFEKIKLFDSLQKHDGFNGFAFIASKNKMTKKIDKESIFYNYFIKLIVKDLIVPKYQPNEDSLDLITVKIILDNRNVSVGHLKSLEDYLNSEFILTNFIFHVDYFDSKNSYAIQATDLIANTFYVSFKDLPLVKDVIHSLNRSKFEIIRFPENRKY